jgi:hypothetical protein
MFLRASQILMFRENQSMKYATKKAAKKTAKKAPPKKK